MSPIHPLLVGFIALLFSASPLVVFGEMVPAEPDLLSPTPGTDAEVDRRFDKARELFAAEKYPEALRDYLWVFDHSRGIGGWGGVRLSYVPGEIMQIAEHLPAARTELQKRRDVREEAMLAGNTDFDIIHEYDSLNSYLGESDRTLDLIDRLDAGNQKLGDLRQTLIFLNWQALTQKGRYDLVADQLGDFVRSFQRQVIEYEINPSFPFDEKDEEHAAYNLSRIDEEGPALYQAAVGSDQPDHTETILNMMLRVDPGAKTYVLLIEAALAAEGREAALDLATRAEAELPEDQLTPVREAMQAIDR